jgi:predicted DCC family thiol-disulfide oxidoreductase YuxK
MTDNKQKWILYDGNCQVCLRMKTRLAPVFEKRGFVWQPLQAEWVGEATGLSEQELMSEMKVYLGTGGVIGGMDAWIYLSRTVWWMYPLFLVGQVEVLRFGMDRCYRAFAARRYCIGGTCRIGGD